MDDRIETVQDFEALIKKQRDQEPTVDELIKAIRLLDRAHLAEYVKFLERNHSDKLNADVGAIIFKKLQIDDPEYIEEFASKITATRIENLERLVYTKADRLFDTYLGIIIPDDFLNQYVLLRANLINYQYDGKFRNSLALIRLAVEINEVPNPDEMFDCFLKMEDTYFESNYPPVDIGTFYKLVIPMLRRYSVKRGPEAFLDLRDRVIDELRTHGVTPDHLSIEILDRRGKHRRKRRRKDDYYGFELY